MKKILTKCTLLFVLPFTLLGCNQKKEEVKPITDKDESTIIKDAKSTDEFIKKQDYKSLAYAYIYNIKDGLKSYESETSGTIKAKIAFINYEIKYNSVTHKKGSAFYSKDHSSSTFSKVDNEFYMADKDKILVSRDLKKYDVYAMDDYKKVSYSMSQYVIMGYVFNDQSIVKADLVSNTDDEITVKYLLDNELATNIVKVDMKINGDLTAYPTFRSIEITLSMKKDFTPISYAIEATYDASKPIIGSSMVTQNGKCLFSKINENITIPNEAKLAEMLGAKPSSIDPEDTERSTKDELLAALQKLDLAHGVNVSGNLTLNLLNSPIAVNIDTNIAFDVSRLSTDKIFNIFSLYAKVEGDETFNSLVSIIKSFAGDKLGEYQAILDKFKSLEVVYDGEGNLYLVPLNQDNIYPTILKVKLGDLLQVILAQVNVYGLITGANSDIFTFNKVDVKDKDNYAVELVLNETSISAVKTAINSFLNNEQYAMLKTLLGYEDFDSIDIKVTVANGMVKDLDAGFNYLKKGSEEGKLDKTSLVKLHLEAKNQTFDFKAKIDFAKELYASYQSVLELRGRIDGLLKNVYANRLYLENLNKAYEEYQALDDIKKGFIGNDIEQTILTTKDKVNYILSFLEVYRKYDLDHVTNQEIYEILKAYRLHILDSELLIGEIGQDNYNKLTNLYEKIDYSSFDNNVSKFAIEDENNWGLNEKGIRDIKLLFDISEYESDVTSHMMMSLWTNGIFVTDVSGIKTKINNLYNKLGN